jgi:hypothetical protein
MKEYPANAVPLDISSTLTDNAVLILIFLGIGIFLVVLFTLINVYDKYKNRIKLDELQAKQEKLKRYATYQKRRSLRDAISMLKPEERAHLYSIWEDNSVVSRKALFRLNELEDRLRRAERGAELKWARSRIADIRDTEKKLFPETFPSKGRGKK